MSVFQKQYSKSGWGGGKVWVSLNQQIFQNIILHIALIYFCPWQSILQKKSFCRCYQKVYVELLHWQSFKKAPINCASQKDEFLPLQEIIYGPAGGTQSRGSGLHSNTYQLVGQLLDLHCVIKIKTFETFTPRND